jgi:hypothetical protein
VSLAAASRDLGRRCVCRYQASRKLDASVDEPACAPAKFGAGPIIALITEQHNSNT